MALTKGLLYPILQETVNFVNAKSMAVERGIKVREAKSSKEDEFANLVTIEIKTDKQTLKICGTLSANKKPRIVKINDYYLEALPQGVMIVLQNWDKPGLIGNVGTFLAKNNVNIAAMTFGRDKPGGKAVSILNVDSPISSELLGNIKKIENVLDVRVIKL
jgi:D-3-phosphoglycerate dehydrogenase